MPVKVIDASALAAVLFGEPEAQAVVDRLQGCILTAPLLLSFELASICLKKIRRYPAKRMLLLEAFELFGQMDITQTEVNAREVVTLAEQKRLSAYDASYLWLAHRLEAELVTLDKILNKAAEDPTIR